MQALSLALVQERKFLTISHLSGSGCAATAELRFRMIGWFIRGPFKEFLDRKVTELVDDECGGLQVAVEFALEPAGGLGPLPRC